MLQDLGHGVPELGTKVELIRDITFWAHSEASAVDARLKKQ